MLGGEQIIFPLKSSVKNDCVRASVAIALQSFVW